MVEGVEDDESDVWNVRGEIRANVANGCERRALTKRCRARRLVYHSRRGCEMRKSLVFNQLESGVFTQRELVLIYLGGGLSHNESLVERVG